VIGYPTNRLVAVIDYPDRAREAVADLVRGGFRPEDVQLLIGQEAIPALRKLGAAPGPLARIVRIFQFMSMDQMPDFVSYEAALRGGRALIAVTARKRERMLAARDILARHGAHFANWFGRFMTEEVTPWRGPEPDIPDYLRR
jgi:hypothetical protein